MGRQVAGTPFAGVAAVVVYAGLLVAGALGSGDADVGPDPAVELVAAFERSRTGTYRATGTFTRTGADGRTLRSPSEVVQDAPDRLVRQFGSVTGRRGDRELHCPAPLPGTPGDGGPTCTLGPPGPGFAVVAAAEVADFAALVLAPDPAYRVTPVGASCWLMTATGLDRRSGFGRRTELCFDADTGALSRRETDHGTAVDVVVHGEITSRVAPDDLEP